MAFHAFLPPSFPWLASSRSGYSCGRPDALPGADEQSFDQVLRKESTMAQNSQKSSRENRAAHLEQFKFQPGQSGNPGGRPKVKPFTERLRQRAEEVVKGRKGNRTQFDVLVDVALDLAKKGNLEAIKFIVERTDGKVPQPVVGRNNGAIEHTFTTPEENEARIAELLNEAFNGIPAPRDGEKGG